MVRTQLLEPLLESLLEPMFWLCHAVLRIWSLQPRECLVALVVYTFITGLNVTSRKKQLRPTPNAQRPMSKKIKMCA